MHRAVVDGHDKITRLNERCQTIYIVEIVDIFIGQDNHARLGANLFDLLTGVAILKADKIDIRQSKHVDKCLQHQAPIRSTLLVFAPPAYPASLFAKGPALLKQRFD